MTAESASARDLDRKVRHCVRESLAADVERLEWIPAGLGMRRFARVRLAGGEPASLIARLDAPEDPRGRPGGVPPEPPLEPIRALLEGAGLPVPTRLGGDEAARVELLEDLGDVDLGAAARAATPGERRALYREACALVPRLQRVRDPGDGRVAAFARRLDAAAFAYKASLLCEWSLPARGRAPSPAEIEIVRDAFGRVAAACAAAPARLAHRDLQSANVCVRPGRPPGQRLALIDLQGALLAPPEYDLVCLLRDSYLELPEDEVASLVAEVRPELPDAPDPESFAQRFDLLTLTRKGKDHARYRFAAATRGDRRYLPFVPATVRYLRAAAERAARREPRLADFAEIVDALPETPCAG